VKRLGQPPALDTTFREPTPRGVAVRAPTEKPMSTVQNAVRPPCRRTIRAATLWAAVGVVALMLLTVPHVARAAPLVTDAPHSGIVGSSTTVSGTGGSASTRPTSITWSDSSSNFRFLCNGAGCPSTTVGGALSFGFSIPPATNGTATITVNGAGYGGASAAFTVVSNQSIAPNRGPPGTLVTDTGTGFDQFGFLTSFTIGSLSPSSSCLFVGTNAEGTFGCQFSVPLMPKGTYAVTATDDAGDANSVPYTVIPGAYPTLFFVNVGTNVNVTLVGFPAYAPVQLYWDPTLSSNTTLASTFTDVTGSGSISFNVPATPYGFHTYRAYSSTGTMVNLTAFVGGALQLTPSSGYVGQSGVVASGTGFPASSAVTLYWDYGSAVQSTLASTTSAANGSFTTTFTVPSAAFGSHGVSGIVAATDYADAAFNLAPPNLTLSPTTGPDLGLFSATLAGFDASQTVNVVWDPLTLNQTTLGTGTLSSRGALTLTGLKVPSTAAPGPHLVAAVDGGGAVQEAVFTVGPWITVSPTFGPSGSTFVISGWTYPSGATIYLNFSAPSTALGTVGPLSGGSGYSYANFSKAVSVPFLPFGAYTVRASTAGGANLATAAFDIVPSLLTSPAGGIVGTTVRVNATGFAASNLALAYVDGLSTGYGLTTNSTGGVTFTFPMPPAAAGAHSVVVADRLGHATNAAVFTVSPSIVTSGTTGYPGDPLGVSGWGFAASSTVTLTWNGVATSEQGPSNSVGSATSVPFRIPASASAGPATLGAFDAAGNFAPTVGITVLSLTVPTPFGPLGGAFVNRSTASLQWSPLPSGGVNYTVQFSTNSSFGPGTTSSNAGSSTVLSMSGLADGWYYWRVEAVAPGGGVSGFSQTLSFLVDTTPPASQVGYLPAQTSAASISIPFTAADAAPGSGVAAVQLYYTPDAGRTWVAYANGTWYTTSPVVFAPSAPGTYGFLTVAKDRAGNVEPRGTTAGGWTLIDPVSPTASATLSGPLGLRGWFTGAVTINLGAIGGPSGVREIDYQLDGGAWTVYSGPWSLAQPLNHTLSVRAVSNTGITGASVLYNIPIDPNSPVTVSNAVGTWYTTKAVTLVLTASESLSGVSATYWSLDNGTWTSGLQATVGTDGVHSIQFYSVSGAGVLEAWHAQKVRVDSAPPVTSAALSGPVGPNGWYTSNVTVTLNANDTTSGVAATYYSQTGANFSLYRGPFVVTGSGGHQIHFYSTDVAGNSGAGRSIAFSIDLGSFLWGTVAPAPSTAVHGTVTVSASVSSPSGIAFVAYSVDGGPWVPMSIVTGPDPGQLVTATGSWDTNGLSPGVHTLEVRATNSAGQSTKSTETVRVDNPNWGPVAFLIALVVLAVIGILVLALAARRKPPTKPSSPPATWTAPADRTATPEEKS
jgi:Big-like domain-containing protein